MPKLHITLPDGSQMDHELTDETVTVGRAPDNTFHLDDVSVSSHHAKLASKEDAFILKDLGSTNGTKLNGAPIKANEDYVLNAGDKIQFGKVEAVFDPDNAGMQLQEKAMQIHDFQPQQVMHGWHQPFRAVAQPNRLAIAVNGDHIAMPDHIEARDRRGGGVNDATVAAFARVDAASSSAAAGAVTATLPARFRNSRRLSSVVLADILSGIIQLPRGRFTQCRASSLVARQHRRKIHAISLCI